MLDWLWDRLLRLILGGDLWYTMLLSMGVRDIEEVKDK